MSGEPSMLFSIFAVIYVVLLVYVVTNFIKDSALLRTEGKSKKEAAQIIRKDYRNGLIDPKHKMFPCGLFLLAVIVYAVLGWGILR